MGIYSSLLIREKDAREIYVRHMKDDQVPNNKDLEAFLDRATEPSLYNVVIVSDDSEEKTSEHAIDRMVEEYAQTRDATLTTSSRAAVMKMLGEANISFNLREDSGQRFTIEAALGIRGLHFYFDHLGKLTDIGGV